MKKEIKDYIGLSLKIASISLIVMFFFMFLSIIFDINPNTSIFEILRIFVLGSYGLVALSLLYFFVSVIYNQFKDKKIFWGIINIILLIFYLANYGENGSDFDFLAFILVLISCIWYYFCYIKPRFRKKK